MTMPSKKNIFEITPHNNLVPFFLKLSQKTILPREQVLECNLTRKLKGPSEIQELEFRNGNLNWLSLSTSRTTCKVLCPMRYRSLECYCKLCDYFFLKEIIEKLGQE